MSTVVMSACWPLQMPPTQKAVLISLADNANDEGFCWPSIDTICERTCFGRTAVIDAIKWLEVNGYLTANRSNGRKTTYTVTVKNQSGRRTGPADEPVRQADPTSPAGGPDQSGRRTLTVINHQEPSKEKPARAARKSGAPISFASFLKACQETGEKPISDYKPVLDYAARAGLPDEFLNLCWQEFKRKHTGSGSRSTKRQKDWRQTFLNCIEGNWYGLWWSKEEGVYELTSRGLQAKVANREAA